MSVYATIDTNHRRSLPAMLDPQGRRVGSTYIRNNLNKKSVGIDLKKGRDLILDLAGKFDIFADDYPQGMVDTTNHV